jgi:hypothetical protein
MHPGKFVVIKNEAIIGLYDSFELAYDATIKTEELGTFIIQEVVNPDDNIAHFASDKVSFSQRI